MFNSRMVLGCLFFCLGLWAPLAFGQDFDEPAYQPEQPPLDLDFQRDINFDDMDGPDQPPLNRLTGKPFPLFHFVDGQKVAVVFDDEGFPIQPPIDPSRGKPLIDSADPVLQEYMKAVKKLTNGGGVADVGSDGGDGAPPARRDTLAEMRRRVLLGQAGPRGKLSQLPPSKGVGSWAGWGDIAEDVGFRGEFKDRNGESIYGLGGSPRRFVMQNTTSRGWMAIFALFCVLVAGGFCFNVFCRALLMAPMRKRGSVVSTTQSFGNGNGMHRRGALDDTGSALDKLRVRVMGQQSGLAKKLDAAC